jgi:Rrf2 family iron-sulfur cluster assembly transcriptional regulator
MRVGTKGRYAVVALIDIANHSKKGPVALGEVAQRQQISLSYLEQLFAMLRRAGLVVASRGPGGGYRIQRPAEEIALMDVFRAVEDGSSPGEGSRNWAAGPGAGVWADLDEHITGFLEQRTLADAAREAGEAPRPGSSALPAARKQPGLSADVKLA